MSLRLKHGGAPIVGTSWIPGGKHSFSHILPVAALCDNAIIENVPNHRDASVLIALLREIFDQVDHDPAIRELRFGRPRERGVVTLSRELLYSSRSCYGMLPALARRCKLLRLEARPRGCVMGSRPDSWYFDTLRRFGAVVESRGGGLDISWHHPQPAHVHFSYPTMTGTVVALAAAARSAAFGDVHINGASVEPSCLEELALLRKLGLNVSGEMPNTVLSGTIRDHVEWRCYPDRVAAVALLTATMLTGGELTVEAASPLNIPKFVSLAIDLGAECREVGNSVTLVCGGSDTLSPVVVRAGSEPLYSSDWVATTVLLLATRTRGTSVVVDEVFPERMQFVGTLQPLGLDNVGLQRARSGGREAGVAIIRGDPTVRLRGGTVARCSDLRGSGAQILASLVANGELLIQDDSHLRRGYEDLPGELAGLTDLLVHSV